MKKMKFKAIELRCLDEHTIRNIREWRNQEFIKEQMFTQNEIGEDEHQAWIEAMRADDNRHLFVFYLDDAPFAVMQSRYYPQYGYAEIGDYLISEDYQAMGYGTFIKFFCAKIMYDHLGYARTYGEILDTNSKNLRTEKKIFGNLRKSQKQKTVDGITHDVYIIEGNRDLWEREQRNKLEPVVYRFVEDKYEGVMYTKEKETTCQVARNWIN